MILGYLSHSWASFPHSSTWQLAKRILPTHVEKIKAIFSQLSTINHKDLPKKAYENTTMLPLTLF